MLTIFSTSSSFHQHTDLHQPPPIRIGPLEHLQRTQRIHHVTEGNDMCSRFSRLSFVVGVYGCRYDEPEKSPPAASQLPYYVQVDHIHEARTLTIKALSKGLRTRLYGHFTTFRLLPPGTLHLSSLCHWVPEAARTCEKERS